MRPFPKINRAAWLSLWLQGRRRHRAGGGGVASCTITIERDTVMNAMDVAVYTSPVFPVNWEVLVSDDNQSFSSLNPPLIIGQEFLPWPFEYGSPVLGKWIKLRSADGPAVESNSVFVLPIVALTATYNMDLSWNGPACAYWFVEWNTGEGWSEYTTRPYYLGGLLHLSSAEHGTASFRVTGLDSNHDPVSAVSNQICPEAQPIPCTATIVASNGAATLEISSSFVPPVAWTIEESNDGETGWTTFDTVAPGDLPYVFASQDTAVGKFVRVVGNAQCISNAAFVWWPASDVVNLAYESLTWDQGNQGYWFSLSWGFIPAQEDPPIAEFWVSSTSSALSQFSPVSMATYPDNGEIFLESTYAEQGRWVKARCLGSPGHHGEFCAPIFISAV